MQGILARQEDPPPRGERPTEARGGVHPARGRRGREIGGGKHESVLGE